MLSRGLQRASASRDEDLATGLPLGGRGDGGTIDTRQLKVLAKHREAMTLLETEPARPLTVEPEVSRLQEVFQHKYVHADYREQGGTQIAGFSTHGGYTPSRTRSLATDVVGLDNPKFFGAVAQAISEAVAFASPRAFVDRIAFTSL